MVIPTRFDDYILEVLDKSISILKRVVTIYLIEVVIIVFSILIHL